MRAAESNKAMGYGGQTGIVFFTLWMLFRRERLLLLVGFDILLRKEENIFFPPFSILKKSSDEFFVASGLL